MNLQNLRVLGIECSLTSVKIDLIETIFVLLEYVKRIFGFK